MAHREGGLLHRVAICCVTTVAHNVLSEWHCGNIEFQERLSSFY